MVFPMELPANDRVRPIINFQVKGEIFEKSRVSVERQRKYLVNLKQIIAKQRFFSPQPEQNNNDNFIEETF